MPKIKTYTSAQMKAAINSAFFSGVDWAETYTSWYAPKVWDNRKNYLKAERAALRNAERLGVGQDFCRCPPPHKVDGGGCLRCGRQISPRLEFKPRNGAGEE